MHRDPDKDFVRVNKIIGKPASIGPIPVEQLFYWIIILVGSYTVTNEIFDWGLFPFIVISIWLIFSCWLLMGNRPYQYTNKWRPTPGHEWMNGSTYYLSPIPRLRPHWLRQRYKDNQLKIRVKPVRVQNPSGGSKQLMPFQNYSDLICIVEIHQDDRQVSAYLLQLGNRYQLVFGFQAHGVHDVLSSSEVSEHAKAIDEATKLLASGERMTFVSGTYSRPELRLAKLKKQAQTCKIPAISVLLLNEEERVKELDRRGTRQVWEQYVFCTWTANDLSDSSRTGWIAQLVNQGMKVWNGFLEQMSGNKRTQQETFFKKLLSRAFSEGFLEWEILINTRMGLNVTPLNSEMHWDYIWSRFNDGAAPPVPQVLKLQTTADGLFIEEAINSDRSATTILLEGHSGRPSCPQHHGTGLRVTLPGKARFNECAAIAMVDPPDGWINTREQIRWLWKMMSTPYVRDTEIYTEVSLENMFLVQDQLSRQAKQSRTASDRAFRKGSGRDVGAEIKQEEAFEAQRRLYQGQKALKCATVFLVYRNTKEELDYACNLLANNLDTAKAIRETNVTFDLWLQSLPITNQRLLETHDLGSERRMTLDSETIAGLLPLTTPRNIDEIGVEFITHRGGKPLYIDVMGRQAKRLLITGESGSGKSVLGQRFILEALANNIPVVGIDNSAAGHSTFKTAIEILGKKGAYYAIETGSINLIEPPDLRHFPPKIQERRLQTWKEFIRHALVSIIMGDLRDPHLIQRVDSLILQALSAFLADQDIIARFNQAWEFGQASAKYQQIPTLHDFVPFCSRERLNLRSYEDIDRRSMNQIVSQLTALLSSKIGQSLGKPTSFSSDAAVKFFALSGLTNEQESQLMAIVASANCFTTALTHPKSLVVGDELSILLKKRGFAQVIGELCATGRKEGIAIIMLSQDLEAICSCETSNQILQNMNYKLHGRLTQEGAFSLQKNLGYPAAIVAPNTSEAAAPRTSDVRSYWLINAYGRFWVANYYPSYMLLGSVANNPDEKAARARVMRQYPQTLKGFMQGLREFSIAYIKALKENQGFDHIGRNSEANIHLKSTRAVSKTSTTQTSKPLKAS
jgi:hypothetical protein